MRVLAVRRCPGERLIWQAACWPACGGPPGSHPSEDQPVSLHDVLLASDPELLDDDAIPLGFPVSQILQQPSPLADEHQQATARVMVLRVALEMLGQAVDAFRQQRDLHLGRTGVALVGTELLDQALLAVERQRHRGASNRHVPEMTPRGGFQKSFFCHKIREEGTTGSQPSKGTAQSRRRASATSRSEEHTSELQSQSNLVCRL